MKALVYHGSKNVKVDTVPDRILNEDTDIILKVTATAICGSDLHLYAGKIPEMKDGDILGHEFMGVVEETGKGVTKLKKGDRVVVPFTISCGHCFFCNLKLYGACETTNTGPGGTTNGKGIKPSAALFGYSHLYGGLPGGQAEYVRVPMADIGPIKIPDSLQDEQVLFLSDILPTGYQAVLNAEIKPGSSVAIYGAGPVGLMSAACARMLNAETIFMIDKYDYRLDFAKKEYNVVPINFEKVKDVAKIIIEQTKNRGVDAVIDAVGFEAEGSKIDTILTSLKIESSSDAALKQCIASVRRGGVVSVPGVYIGLIHAFHFGDAFDKGITIKMGQTHVQKFLPELLKAIEDGNLKTESIISHRLPLEEAENGYKMFYEKTDDCRKVILKP